MCKGDVCNARNNKALDFCKKDHVLYLAYFPNNTVKVGTTVFERRYERMLEQGAIFSFFIAKINGMNIRRMEIAISKLGILKTNDHKFVAVNFRDLYGWLVDYQLEIK